jgi:hypothetical protein
MDDVITTFVTDMIGRVDGQMKFRLVLQPLMATLLALRDGRRDALAGRVPYDWALLTEPAERHELLEAGWKGVSRVFILAFLLDVVYQFIVLHDFYPVQALFTGLLLAVVPYAILRGPFNRLTRHKRLRRG